ncbi:hypothetical protein [Staphylococcus succinus]|uniref:hypothetical protein n=1 Tax=Staphylococcus succinus TaxID=61015 RepID=UPI00301DB08A
MDQSHNKPKYILTMHAKERYRERVVGDGKGKSNVSALKWVTRALNNGYLIGKNSDGTTTYRYQKFLIVMGGKTVITISYHNDRDVRPLKEDINKIITRRLRKELKPLIANRKNLMIKSHELDIEALRTNSRAKQVRLQDERDELVKEYSTLKSQIKTIVDFANKYGIAKQDIVLETDLV